jgi:hypothetical protein
MPNKVVDLSAIENLSSRGFTFSSPSSTGNTDHLQRVLTQLEAASAKQAAAAASLESMFHVLCENGISAKISDETNRKLHERYASHQSTRYRGTL